MKKKVLAARLIGADATERQSLMTGHVSLLDAELAAELKALFDRADAGDPAQAVRVAEALAAVSDFTGDDQITALAEWTGGIVALEAEGRADVAAGRLRQAASRFLALGEPLKAASVQVSLLQALAMLGEYEPALDCGLQARAVFLGHGDELAAGKIELNLGNLYCRRDRYPEAEQLHRAAQTRFAALGDQKLLTMAESCLALTLTYQYKFREAEPLYRQALARAEAAELGVAQAVIECNLGNLALFQGRYDQALDYLERSRRRYEDLEMPHESAISELELADAYLELNLAPEAAAIAARVVSVFDELGMRAEQARAAANHGRACLLLGKLEDAEQSLSSARALFAGEGNSVGEAAVRLTEAQILFLQGRFAEAADSAMQAETALAAAGSWGRQLLARWLRADCARKLGRWDEARQLLNATLRDAELQAIPQIACYCQTSLGELSAATGDAATAEHEFKRAVALIEEMRAPLPADEFRTAFVADKLTPYLELARLCLNDGATDRAAEALGYVERARSRALVEMMSGALAVRQKPRDAYEAELLAELEELRGELSWFYNQINRPPEDPAAANPANTAALFQAAREREDAILRLRRQLEQRGGSELPLAKAFDFDQLQTRLGADTALVEYFSLGEELLAFVVTDEGIGVARDLGNEQEIRAALDSLHFQLGSLRYGSEKTQRHLPRLLERARHYLTKLYDSLLRPMESRLGERRLVVVPHRALHYVPFHALHDGAEHVIERREVCYAPSAGVLLHCLSRPLPEFRRALLLGVPDEQTPRVRDEVLAVAPLFPESAVLLDDQATLAALRKQASSADLLHLACHGQFRQDSPLFSSLQLADGWLTVRDAAGLELNCGLVALSACETGVNLIAPGDELIGLARGFFSAGAPSLLVSLWKVSDESTAKLMTLFYERLRLGERPAAALRHAQRELMRQYPHPFFWSPFVLLGRW
jgi:CHAT domain-containing protein/tetratricopeptide (TPR) repeat protein